MINLYYVFMIIRSSFFYSFIKYNILKTLITLYSFIPKNKTSKVVRGKSHRMILRDFVFKKRLSNI